MVVKNGATGDKHQIETMMAGVAVFDYDGDGWPDIYVCNGAVSTGLRKDGEAYSNVSFATIKTARLQMQRPCGCGGRATPWGSRQPTSTTAGGPISSSPESHVAGAALWAVAAGWFDYDGDGQLDLFVVRYVAWDPRTEPLCADPRPGYRHYCHPKYYAAPPKALYNNQRDGTFRDVSAESGIGARVCRQRHGSSSPTSTTMGDRTSSSPKTPFRDYDNDGWRDIFVAALSNEGFTPFRNLGRGAFSEVTQSAGIAGSSLLLSGWSTGILDFNNDGFKDIFVANGHVDEEVVVTR